MTPNQLKDHVVEALEDMKAQNVVTLDVAEVSSFTDYMVVATGTSDTHVRSIANAVATDLSQKGSKPLSEEGSDVSEWVLVDFGDVVLHVMRQEVRDFYELEKLWDTEVRKMLEQSRSAEND